jgi:hypothetical protein
MKKAASFRTTDVTRSRSQIGGLVLALFSIRDFETKNQAFPDRVFVDCLQIMESGIARVSIVGSKKGGNGR